MKNRYDALLDKIDIAILSVSPIIYIEQFTHPLFTDIFYLFYLIYFPMPIIILGVMFKKNMFVEVEKIFTHIFIHILPCLHLIFLRSGRRTAVLFTQ